MFCARFFPLAMLPLLACAGCAEGPIKPDPAFVGELQKRFVLGTEPTGAQTPLDWRDARETSTEEPADESAEATSVVLVGQIGGMPNPWGAEVEPHFPWRQDEATFFLVDPSTCAEFSSHASEAGEDHAADCPFCAREAAKKANSVAVVTFMDENKTDQPLAISAQQAFGLQAGDLVVVRGQWNLVGDLLVIEADGIFKR